MTTPLLDGVSAAVLTPRTALGEIAEDQFRQLLRFLLDRGIRSFAINGATGEFPLTTPAQMEQLLSIASAMISPRRGQFVVGIGAAGLVPTLTLGRMAALAGAKAVLLSMPYFFPYHQEDLVAYATAVADELTIPVLLYNLPQFTTGLAPETTLRLIRGHRNIVGIKDSSGSLDTLRLLTRNKIRCSRIVGNDSALAPALAEGLCDGVVSGVACVLPELLQRVFTEDPKSEAFRIAARSLDDFIAQINVLPVPWGLKVIAEARSLGTARFALPLSVERAGQIDRLRTWFAESATMLLAETSGNAVTL